MKAAKPWEVRWRIVEGIGSGGQGSTHIVRSINGDECGCMKLLRDNESPDRRERFRRECAAFETLDHQAVPKYLDCNSRQYRTQERLYLVTELISGSTLAKHIERNRLDFNTALQLVISLLGTVEYIHTREFVHRDIKPDNLILRNDDPNDVVLVDFGLSYYDQDNNLSTATHQQLGNRFLHLPELQLPSADKRNPVSDITQVVGIFFYCITGEHPTTLFDERGLLPHQRNKTRAELDKLPEGVRANVLGVFDQGFQATLSSRWQSAMHLRKRLESIANPRGDATGASIVDDLQAALRSNPEYVHRRRSRDLFREFERIVTEVFSHVLAEFEADTISCGANSYEDMSTLTFTRNQHLSLDGFGDRSTVLATSCSLLGNELLVRAHVEEHGRHVDLGRLSSSPPHDWTDVRMSLRSEILYVITHFVSKGIM